MSSGDWIYALVAPFPTIMDGVSLSQLRAVWDGESSEAFSSWPMWMSSSTLSAFTSLWGTPAADIHVEAPDRLLDSVWAAIPGWAIVPFESLEPRWKVLTVDGQSPIRKDFDSTVYPLQVRFALTSSTTRLAPNQLPPTNRDASKLTTVIMTGTSALVREIAYQMEVHGIDYPGRDIGDLLREADILHLSHETSFDPACPPPNPYENRFYCSDPKYIGLFDDVGVDVVELTGNHILDQGTAAMLYTLKLFRDHHIAYFGGGSDLAEARQPLLVENHGNKVAFLGCSAAEPPQPLAGTNMPGSNPCNWSQLAEQMQQLRARAICRS